MIAIPVTSAHADPGHGHGHGFGRGHGHGHHHHHPPFPYGGGKPTSTTATPPSTSSVGKPEPISVDVSSLPGLTTPTGTVAVTVSGPGGYTWSGTRDVSGTPKTLEADPLLEPGFYAVSALYSPDAGSAFKPSTASAGFFVADPSKSSRIPVLN